MEIVRIAWGVTPSVSAQVISKTDALRQVAKATVVRAYEEHSVWELAVAFGLSRYEDARLEWYAFSSPQGEVICVSKDSKTYWVQDGDSLPSIR